MALIDTKWCELDKQDKQLKALEDAIKAGVHEIQGELEARKVELEEELSKSRKILADFKVHERYKDIQVEANQLTVELHQLANQNVSEGRKLKQYESAIVDETPPDQVKLEAIYEETGVVFPDSVKRTLEEASAFHNQIIKNRASFLEAEIVRIKNEITRRENLIKVLNDKRATCMELLNTHGALEEYSCLQEEHTKIKAKFEQTLNKIEDIRDKQKDEK